MKVLMISTVPLNKNGIATCVLNYSKQLALNNISVDIVSPNIVSNELKEDICKYSINLYEIPTRKSNPVNYLFSLLKIIKKRKYDIIHVHGNSCTIALELLMATLGGCKTRIAHSHNTTCEHVRAHKLLRPIFEITCNGRFACGTEAGKWLFGKKDFIIIRNGIHLDNYSFNFKTRTKIRNELGISPNKFLLGHVGTFNYQKNHEFLIRLLSIMPKNYSLLCIGSGETEGKIKKIIKEKRLNDRVYFTGDISNVSDYLQGMDCFLLPSRYEGLPYVLIEAQASGLSCIVSDKVSNEANLSGDIQFLPIDGFDNWANEIELIKKIVENGNRDELCQEWKVKLRKSGYDISDNTKQLINIYQNMILKKRE